MFEYFLLGLILMWVYNLGPWLHPTNLIVIFTFIFSLYRKNKTTEDLSAEDIGRLFPFDDSRLHGVHRAGLASQALSSSKAVRLFSGPCWWGYCSLPS